MSLMRRNSANTPADVRECDPRPPSCDLFYELNTVERWLFAPHYTTYIMQHMIGCLVRDHFFLRRKTRSRDVFSAMQ